MLAGRPPFAGFWGGFSCFISFIWCQLFACLIRAAIFRLLAWLGQPFKKKIVCHHHLWFGLSFFAIVICGLFFLSFFATGICVQPLSFTAFSAVGIHVRLFVFALVWGYQYTSQFLASCSALAACQPSRGPHGQPADILCSMGRTLTSGWPWFQWCLARLRETCFSLVCDFVIFSLVSVFLLFSLFSFFFVFVLLDVLRC